MTTVASEEIAVYQGERPRNVDASQAAAILYGDWGTSKAYVVGLAFALAALSSPWLIFFASVLNLFVGLNYVLICKCYPYGGGVYASVRHRSEVIALIGAFFLICDYIITASLSSFAAFSYLGVDHPVFWAIFAIFAIGAINYFGPRQTGNLALVIAVFAFAVVLVLGFFSLFFVEQGFKNLQPLSGSFKHNWVEFVSVIVALSGVESIANMTGLMRLDPGTQKAPTVLKTSTPALISVMLEVSIFTTLFSLAINALPGLVVTDGVISAPGYPDVQDSMLKYMGGVFCSHFFSEPICQIFVVIVSLAFGILLLSAVNTAIVALSSLLFILSRDRQLPQVFSCLNSYGVPILALIISTLAPMLVLLYANDLLTLASFYAVGFVGAIATNLTSTSTDKTLSLKNWQRAFMFFTAVIMLAVEVTLFIEKPDARYFLISVVAIGLLLKSFVREASDKEVIQPVTFIPTKEGEALLCAVTHRDKGLDFAIREAKLSQKFLYVLFVRDQRILKQPGAYLGWDRDQKAKDVLNYVRGLLKDEQFVFIYDITDSPALNIVERALHLKVASVILERTRSSRVIKWIRGDTLTQLYKRLPKNIELIVVS